MSKATKSATKRVPAKRIAKKLAKKSAAKSSTAKSAPSTKAAAVSLTKTWAAIFSVLEKKEKMTRAELTAVAEKHGAKGWYGRFLRAGFVTRPEHGTYALTPTGKKAVEAAKSA